MEVLKAHWLQIHGRKGWLAVGITFLVLTVLLPTLNAGLAEDSALRVPDYLITLLGKFMCFGIVALAIDLIWGFTGILSLGHGVFFALGGYAIGMHMMRSMAGEGVYKSDLPDFMVFLDWKELPWFWHGFDSFGFAVAMALIVPGLLAFVFGFFAFRSRISGVYFSIITQALTFAFMLGFFRNETGLGGNNGLTDFKRLYGYTLADPSTKLGLYVLSSAALVATYLLSRYLITGRAGRLLRAIRDHEGKVRFSGYSPLKFKLFVWTLSAVLCGLAGALYVPQVGIINPSEMRPANSIEMAIWVAVGGRATLLGAPIGALLINGSKSWFTASFPDYWLYFLGALFIIVTLYFPSGVVGTVQNYWARRKPAATLPPSSGAPSSGAPSADVTAEAPTTEAAGA
ncbi:MAG TPA: urea ABC transporter permease subunit UrtC [Polyangiaceae bacterium]|jgi:urea transport system permease protein|nr:urea ABC transporter permease subunit UrtC [Polyangiaceae bacterium]